MRRLYAEVIATGKTEVPLTSDNNDMGVSFFDCRCLVLGGGIIHHDYL